MAIVTRIRCHTDSGVGRGLVVLIRPNNVTARSGTAAGNYSNVVPACRAPCKSPVAAIAGISCFPPRVVVCGFSSCLPAVVAGRALPRFRGSVVVACAQPGGSVEVAAVARCVGDDMSTGFRCCHDTLADRMAAVTIFWCAFEHSAHMAGFAGSRRMSAGKRKARCHVIEITATQLLFCHSLQGDYGQHNRKKAA